MNVSGFLILLKRPFCLIGDNYHQQNFSARRRLWTYAILAIAALLQVLLVFRYFVFQTPVLQNMAVDKVNGTRHNNTIVLPYDQHTFMEPRMNTSVSSKLRLDWANLSVSSSSSPLAFRFYTHQRNCALPMADFRYRNRFGLGSDLHVWTQAMCNSVQEGVRVRTETPWIFVDAVACHSHSTNNKASAMSCYFPGAEPPCPMDNHSNTTTNTKPKLYSGNGNIGRNCEQVQDLYNLSLSDVRASGIEYLFAQTSPIVVQEAQRQLDALFGVHSSSQSSLPSRLITVHVRWGDKKHEKKLRPIREYVQAVRRLILEHGSDDFNALPQSNNHSIGIYLATEDPLAVQHFQQEAAKYNWTVYLDLYFQEFAAVRDGGYNGNPRMAQHLQGRPGLVALASLLVAMQANDFVLTTSSNWSRLMNELRKNVLDPRCNSCTRMIDLSPGEW